MEIVVFPKERDIYLEGDEEVAILCLDPTLHTCRAPHCVQRGVSRGLGGGSYRRRSGDGGS